MRAGGLAECGRIGVGGAESVGDLAAAGAAEEPAGERGRADEVLVARRLGNLGKPARANGCPGGHGGWGVEQAGRATEKGRALCRFADEPGTDVVRRVEENADPDLHAGRDVRGVELVRRIGEPLERITGCLRQALALAQRILTLHPVLGRHREAESAELREVFTQTGAQGTRIEDALYTALAVSLEAAERLGRGADDEVPRVLDGLPRLLRWGLKDVRRDLVDAVLDVAPEAAAAGVLARRLDGEASLVLLRDLKGALPGEGDGVGEEVGCALILGFAVARKGLGRHRRAPTGMQAKTHRMKIPPGRARCTVGYRNSGTGGSPCIAPATPFAAAPRSLMGWRS